ncbi:hypothetical protein ACJJTC_017717 [Scirpophaga incertulas]
MARTIWFVVLLALGLTWNVEGAVNCTASGAGRIPEPTDTTCKNYTLCVRNSATGIYSSYDYVCPATSLFDPNTARCTTAYVCNVTDSTTSVCTTEGYIPNPNVTDCSSYVECVNIDGIFLEESYNCPSDTFFNPTNTFCESDYNCTSHVVPFTCKSAGRFANISDTTCKTYYFCVLAANGTYVQYDITCPGTSVFSPVSRLCTTLYICPVNI